MGARFADLPGYYNLVLAHGILAAITFLFLVPFAIMINRFYASNRFLAIRLHIWANILTVFLTTVVFILGCFQVGPQRSFTNPHHGIGLALFIAVLVQFVLGYLNHQRARGKKYTHPPVRVILHHWLGRVVGLLGIAQVGLGLTVYGSPKSLFILYALAVFVLIVAYFILDAMRARNAPHQDRNDYEYASADGTPPRQKRKRLLALGEGAALGGVLGALASRFRGRRRPSGSSDGYTDSQSGLQSHVQNDTQQNNVQGNVQNSVQGNTYTNTQSQAQSVTHNNRPYGRPPNGPQDSYVSEKYSDEGGDAGRHTWRNRLLGLGALGGLGYWLNNRFRRRRDDDFSENGTYENESVATTQRVEEGAGRPSASVAEPNGQPPRHARTQSQMSEESAISGSPSRHRPRRGIRDGLLGLGGLGAATMLFNPRKRRERKEQRRIEELRQQELEDERIQRAHSRRYTGDGFSRRHGRQSSAGTNATAAQPPMAGNSGPSGPSPLLPGGILPMPQPTFAQSGPLLGHAGPGPSNLGPPLPMHDPMLSRPSTAGTGTVPYNRPGTINAAELGAAGLGGAALGAGAAEASSRQRRRSRDDSPSRQRRTDSAEPSPGTPVSVKLNMHPDGRHVTLRRLTEEEAERERARRGDNAANVSAVGDLPGPSGPPRRTNRRRPGSAGSFSGNESGGSWRRNADVRAPPQTQPPYPMAPGRQPPLQMPMPQPGYGADDRGAAAPRRPSTTSTMPASTPGNLTPRPGAGQQQGGPGGSYANLHAAPAAGLLPLTSSSNVNSPGYDVTSGTEASVQSNYAENRRRRRAQRAQTAAAAAGDGTGPQAAGLGALAAAGRGNANTPGLSPRGGRRVEFSE